MRRLASLLVLLAVSVTVWSCGRDELAPFGSFGGSGGEGDRGTGGTATGGVSTGGSFTGGFGGTVGFAGTGGRATGGSAGTGGRATGGAAGTGGRNTGGVAGTGGVGTGGFGPDTGGHPMFTGGSGAMGGVPTGGIVGTGGRPMGGTGGIPETPGVIACGKQFCKSFGESCCVSGTSAALTNSCVPQGAPCPGVSIGCEEPSDCGSGQTCCLGFSFGGQMSLGVGSTCTSQSACRVSGFSLCRSAADCPSMQGCCAQPGGVGICRFGC